MERKKIEEGTVVIRFLYEREKKNIKKDHLW